MKFCDLDFSSGQVFIAMEYYYLILNRTFLVVIGDDDLIGIKIRGVVSCEVDSSPLTGSVTKYLAVTGDIDNPNSYINSDLLHIYEELDIQDAHVMDLDNANFKIKFDDILNIYHDKRKKWGMGYYPHDGKIYIETNDANKELIILGNQQGGEIVKRLNFALEKYK